MVEIRREGFGCSYFTEVLLMAHEWVINTSHVAFPDDHKVI